MTTTLTSVRPVLEFCGALVAIDRAPFTIGREADLAVDPDNRFLHRHFLTLSAHGDVWLLANTGRQLTATVSDAAGQLEAFLSPGAVLPLAFAVTRIRFTAGPTTYELTIHLPAPPFSATAALPDAEGDTTVGRVPMTPEQLRLIVALAEPVLRGAGRAASTLPSNAEAAHRLGWTTTKFNRKLDNVCQKLTVHGIRGLHGDPSRLASNRRARLVEYALASRLVTRDDLCLLP